MVYHTDKCLSAKRKQEAWDALWPLACKECHATGVVSWYEHIDEFGGMICHDACEACLGKSRCPRCGHQHDENWNLEDEHPCTSCGWSPEINGDDMVRPYFSCDCLEEEIVERMDNRYVLDDVDYEHYDYYSDDLAFDAAREKRMR